MKHKKYIDLLKRKEVIGSIGAIDFLIKIEHARYNSLLSKPVHICLITDENYVTPTAVTIFSIIKSKNIETKYIIHIVAINLKEKSIEIINSLKSTNVDIRIIEPKKIEINLSLIKVQGDIISATPSALYKFLLPYIIQDADRLLYLDSDLIINDDLTNLYFTDIDGCTIAAVADSGQIYFKHHFVKKVKKYFNSGVMLIDCVKFKKFKYNKKLIETRLNLSNSNLMDQDAFNVVFDGCWYPLSIKYNLLWVNLCRAKSKWSIEEINSLYKTSYKNINEVESDAKIIHFSSKDKPWKSNNTPLSEMWHKVHNEFSLKLHNERNYGLDIQVTVIIPVFNTVKYLEDCLKSVASQDNVNIEIICVSDGSCDDSWLILEKYRKNDRRFTVLYQNNQGQSVARNHALKFAQGKYIYFIDSDDILKNDALSECSSLAIKNDLDVVYFDAEAFFENEFLKQKYIHYENYYRPKGDYPKIMTGEEAFNEFCKAGIYRPSPVLKIIKKDFLEEFNINFFPGIIHEDNLFSLCVILQARKVKKISKSLYLRRVREGSTMTSEDFGKSASGYLICFSEMIKMAHSIKISENNFDYYLNQINGMLKQAKLAFNKVKEAELIEEGVNNILIKTIEFIIGKDK